MARPKKSNTMKSLEAIDRNLSRLRNDVGELVRGVRADTAPILTSVHARLTSSLDEAQGVVAPLVAILRGAGSPRGRNAVAKAPKKPASPVPTKKAGPKKTGRRGVKANLSAEQIKAALDATGGVKSRAAARLGVTVTTFDKYLASTGASGGSKAAAKKKSSKKTRRKNATGAATNRAAARS